MLKRILFAGLTLAAASFGAPGTANAHRYGLAPHGPWPAHAAHALYAAHAARGAGFARARWRPAPRAAWTRSTATHARGYARTRLAAIPIAAPGGAVGRASFYSGGRTASGGTVGAATCAHRSLPFGTRVLVTNLANLRQMVLTVNDRGPFTGGRMMDVSRTAAAALGMLQAGVANIRMQVIGGPG